MAGTILAVISLVVGLIAAGAASMFTLGNMIGAGTNAEMVSWVPVIISGVIATAGIGWAFVYLFSAWHE